MSGHNGEYVLKELLRCIAHTALDRDVTAARAELIAVTRLLAEAGYTPRFSPPAVSAVTQHEQP